MDCGMIVPTRMRVFLLMLGQLCDLLFDCYCGEVLAMVIGLSGVQFRG